MLAKVLQKSNVIIGRERAKSAEIAINELGADCLVMDDGFQHRALARDIDIVLLMLLTHLVMTMYYPVVYYENRLVGYRELVLLFLPRWIKWHQVLFQVSVSV